MKIIHDQPKLSRLDLNLFRVFDVVYRERNLTRAAEVLFLSQSAVSHALKRMRAQWHDPLFVREGQGVLPTPLAERLAPVIREALQGFQQALHRLRDFDPKRDLVHFTLAMNDELESSLLPPMVAYLRTQAPDIQIASVRLDRGNLKTDLASGRLDLAIDVAQSTHPDLHHEILLRDSLCVVSGRRRKLTLASYLSAQHIAVSSRRTGLTVEDLMLNRLGYQRQIALRCQHYEAACRMLVDSGLLLTMPRRHAQAINTFLHNKLLPMPINLPSIDLHLYWHRQVHSEPGNQWLRASLFSLASALR